MPGLGAVAHAYNLALWEAKAGGSPEDRSLRPACTTWWNTVSTKNTKISQHAPVIPATQEAETGELLELRRGRFQWAEIIPLHSSLYDRMRPSQKIKYKQKSFPWAAFSQIQMSYIPGIWFLVHITDNYDTDDFQTLLWESWKRWRNKHNITLLDPKYWHVR